MISLQSFRSFQRLPAFVSWFLTCRPNFSNSQPFNTLPPRSNDTHKVIYMYLTFVLFSLVYLHTELRSAESHPRCFEHPTKDAHPELSSGAEGAFSAARPPQFLTLTSVPLSHRFPCPITLIPRIHNLFRINTCKSLSKQTTLTVIMHSVLSA